jgi:hypothetical protein
MEDAVDVAGQSAHVGQHVFEILSLVFFRKIVFEEGFQVQFKRCDRCFELVGEVVDEILLIAVKLEYFLVIHEAHEYPSEDNTADQGEYQGDNPCSALKNEKGVEIQSAYEFLKPVFYFDIPVYTKKQGEPQRCHGKKKQGRGMGQPFISVDDDISQFERVSQRCQPFLWT